MKEAIKEKICLAPKGENVQCEYCNELRECFKKAKEIEQHFYSGPVDIYITENEIVVCGNPYDMMVDGEKLDDNSDEHPHNCDEMGCSSISHVIFRTNIIKEVLE